MKLVIWLTLFPRQVDTSHPLFLYQKVWVILFHNLTKQMFANLKHHRKLMMFDVLLPSEMFCGTVADLSEKLFLQQTSLKVFAETCFINVLL